MISPLCFDCLQTCFDQYEHTEHDHCISSSSRSQFRDAMSSQADTSNKAQSNLRQTHVESPQPRFCEVTQPDSGFWKLHELEPGMVCILLSGRPAGSAVSGAKPWYCRAMPRPENEGTVAKKCHVERRRMCWVGRRRESCILSLIGPSTPRA